MNETLSYNGCANIGINLVLAQYPIAKLMQVTGSSSSGQSGTEPTVIDQMQVVFSYQPEDTEMYSITINTTAWGEFGEPQVIEHAFTETVAIGWPVGMDLPEANDLKKDAGYNDAYKVVILVNMLAVPIGNPQFKFSNGNFTPTVSVDTVTKQVTESK